MGKNEKGQLQSWNILTYNPKTTDVDEHIDLINTLVKIPLLLHSIANPGPHTTHS